MVPFSNNHSLGFLLSSNNIGNTGKVSISESAIPFQKGMEKFGVLEKEVEFFRENFKLLQDKLSNLERQNQKSRQSIEEAIKASMKKELERERERIDQLILDSLSKATPSSLSGGEGKIDFNFVSDLINTRISKELETKVYLDQEKLVEMINKHISSFKALQSENKQVLQCKSSVDTNNWALRSLGTRIYRLGTTRPFTKNQSWRGWLRLPADLKEYNRLMKPRREEIVGAFADPREKSLLLSTKMFLSIQ